MTPILQLVDVHKTFATDPPIIPLQGIDLTVEAGQLASVSGTSGKGKTTLLNVAGGILKPEKGRVLFCGEDLVAATPQRLDEIHRCGIGFVFQTPYLIAALSIRENLAAAQRVALGKADQAVIGNLLEEVGLADRSNALPHELSVGQRRRVAFARILVSDHKLILADEPTNDLDEGWSDFIFQRLASLAHDQQRAVVVVTHDTHYANRADVHYLLENGVLACREGEAC